MKNIFLNISETAVLLIDMQDGFIYECKEALELIPKQVMILEFAERNSIPIFVITCFRRGNLNDELSQRINKISSEILYKIEKDADSGFYKTELNNILKECGSKNLILMGVNAGSCVKATAKDAISNGYHIITSKAVITDSYYSKTLPKKYRKCDLSWYKENGIYTKNHFSLIKLFLSDQKNKKYSQKIISFFISVISFFKKAPSLLQS